MNNRLHKVMDIIPQTVDLSFLSNIDFNINYILPQVIHNTVNGHHGLLYGNILSSILAFNAYTSINNNNRLDKLFELLDAIGKATRRNSLPFGGIQLIFSGDFFQLPPVGDNSVFCFESPLWDLTFSKENCIELKKIFRQKNNFEYWQFMSEYTRLQQPSTFPVRSAGTWYVHGAMSGYDQEGQILGAPSGSGGNYGMIRLSKFKGWKQLGIQLESCSPYSDDFEGSNLAFSNPSLTKWVDYGFRVLYDHPFKQFLLSGTVAFKRSFNYNFSQPFNASGLGIANPNDVDSYLIKLTIRYR